MAGHKCYGRAVPLAALNFPSNITSIVLRAEVALRLHVEHGETVRRKKSAEFRVFYEDT